MMVPVVGDANCMLTIKGSSGVGRLKLRLNDDMQIHHMSNQ